MDHHHKAPANNATNPAATRSGGQPSRVARRAGRPLIREAISAAGEQSARSPTPRTTPHERIVPFLRDNARLPAGAERRAPSGGCGLYTCISAVASPAGHIAGLSARSPVRWPVRRCRSGLVLLGQAVRGCRTTRRGDPVRVRRTSIRMEASGAPRQSRRRSSLSMRQTADQKVC